MVRRRGSPSFKVGLGLGFLEKGRKEVEKKNEEGETRGTYRVGRPRSVGLSRGRSLGFFDQSSR